jgi:hypothetical protein
MIGPHCLKVVTFSFPLASHYLRAKDVAKPSSSVDKSNDYTRKITSEVVLGGENVVVVA